MTENRPFYCNNSNPKRCKRCCKMFEMLYILIMTDQRVSGLWGYSEAPIARAILLGKEEYSRKDSFIRGSTTHTDVIAQNLKNFLNNIRGKNDIAKDKFEVVKRSILNGLKTKKRVYQNKEYYTDIMMPIHEEIPNKFIDRNIRHTSSGVMLLFNLDQIGNDFYSGVNFLLNNYEKAIDSLPIITVPTLFRLVNILIDNIDKIDSNRIQLDNIDIKDDREYTIKTYLKTIQDYLYNTEFIRQRISSEKSGKFISEDGFLNSRQDVANDPAGIYWTLWMISYMPQLIKKNKDEMVKVIKYLTSEKIELNGGIPILTGDDPVRKHVRSTVPYDLGKHPDFGMTGHMIYVLNIFAKEIKDKTDAEYIKNKACDYFDFLLKNVTKRNYHETSTTKAYSYILGLELCPTVVEYFTKEKLESIHKANDQVQKLKKYNRNKLNRILSKNLHISVIYRRVLIMFLKKKRFGERCLQEKGNKSAYKIYSRPKSLKKIAYLLAMFVVLITTSYYLKIHDVVFRLFMLDATEYQIIIVNTIFALIASTAFKLTLWIFNRER